MTKEIKLLLKGLHCANCGNKIEGKGKKIEHVKECVLNFSLSMLVIEIQDEKYEDEVVEKVKGIVKALEPDVKVVPYFKEKHRGESSCGKGCCSGDHGHVSQEKNEEETFPQIERLFLIIGVILFIIGSVLGEDHSYAIYIFGASYVLVGGKVVSRAFNNIMRGQIFDENFLMTIATIGAFIIGSYPEGVAVMIFYEIGELFQGYAVNKSRKSISSLMDIRADYANLLVEGVEKQVNPNEVKVSDIILIKPGERVPLDGVVVEGNTTLDTSALTGESLPRNIEIGEEVLAGVINLTGVIKVKVKSEFGESTVSKILDLVQNASSKKAETEKFITKFARYYTPVVVFSALALAIIPPFVIEGADFSTWIYRALIFLVVSCPCALVVSIPLGLFAGIGGASKIGVLVKGGNYLEALKDVETVVFDKTGTLTKGVFKVVKIHGINIETLELLRIAALGESYSNHPIAQSIVKEYGKEINKDLVSDYTEVSGNGILAKVEGAAVLIGNYKLMEANNINYVKTEDIGTVVHVVVENQYKGYIVISDEVKEDSKDAILALKKLGVKKCVMLTGDNKKVGEKIGKELELDEVYSELLPTDKVEKLEGLLKEQSEKGKLVFVGDGINDAPVLARADIGVAMGGLGSDAAIEASDVVLMRDTPSSLVDAIEVGRKTNIILWQNIIFSLGVKGVILGLAIVGVANMWEGVFADVGVTLLAVLNSMRALRK